MTMQRFLERIHSERLLERAANVVDNLNNWLNDTEDTSTVPTATMHYTGSYLSVSIGHEVLWDTEDAPAEELTIEACLKEWIKCQEEMIPFIEKHKLESK